MSRPLGRPSSRTRRCWPVPRPQDEEHAPRREAQVQPGAGAPPRWRATRRCARGPRRRGGSGGSPAAPRRAAQSRARPPRSRRSGSAPRARRRGRTRASPPDGVSTRARRGGRGPGRPRRAARGSRARSPRSALAEVRVAHAPAGVDQVLGRPVLVAVRAPGREVVVLCDRVAQPVARDGPLDVAGVSLERELRRVQADDRQPLSAVAGVPGPELGSVRMQLMQE